MERRKFISSLVKVIGVASILPFVSSLMKKEENCINDGVVVLKQSSAVTITLPSPNENDGVGYDFVCVKSDGKNWIIENKL